VSNAGASLKLATKQSSIVAIHGLYPTADAQNAWDTWRKPAGETGRLWLRDDLPKYTPRARIFLYEYDSKLVYKGKKAEFMDRANALLEALREERKMVTLPFFQIPW
jgi:hypothetical protein